MDKNEQQKYDEIWNKANRRATMYAVGMLAILAGLVATCEYFRYKKQQWAQIQAEKDSKTEMTLIDFKRSWSSKGEAGVMFFSRTEQTNSADAVMHYATRDLEAIERIRHVKVGEKKKVSEWKKIVTDKYGKYVKTYDWFER